MKKYVLAIALIGAALVAGKAEAQGYCREFSQGVNIGGRIQSSYGMACMQPDGSWQIVRSGQDQISNVGYHPPPQPMQPIYSHPSAAYYPPSPPAYYVPPPPPIVQSGFSLSFGVPFHRGRGDCDDRDRWRGHGHHDNWRGNGWGHHGGWGGGGGHHGWRRHHDD